MAWWTTNGRNPKRGRRASTYELTAKGTSQLAELNDYWKSINATVNQLGR